MGVTARFAGSRCLVAGHGLLADAIERRLLAEGARVVCLGEGVRLAAEPGAMTEVAGAVAELGGLDVAVTAFSSRDDRPFLELDDDLWRRTLDENLTSAFLVGRESARAMLLGEGGVIVHVGSDVGANPGAGTAAYAAAKAGVHLLAAGMALDLAPQGVRVCAVAAAEGGSDQAGGGAAPGPEAVAGAVAFCASSEASYVLGSTLFVSGRILLRS